MRLITPIETTEIPKLTSSQTNVGCSILPAGSFLIAKYLTQGEGQWGRVCPIPLDARSILGLLHRAIILQPDQVPNQHIYSPPIYMYIWFGSA
jgi:hypothetical protein